MRSFKDEIFSFLVENFSKALNRNVFDYLAIGTTRWLMSAMHDRHREARPVVSLAISFGIAQGWIIKITESILQPAQHAIPEFLSRAFLS